MSIQSKPYYWVVCDEPGCERKSTDGGDYTAWSEEDHALDDADASEWLILDDVHYCYEHSTKDDPDTQEES